MSQTHSLPPSDKDKPDIVKQWWQPYASLMVDISGWLVGPVIAGLFVGRWLDQKFHTAPWLMLLTLGLAFMVTNVAIMKKGLAMLKKINGPVKTDQDQTDKHDIP